MPETLHNAAYYEAKRRQALAMARQRPHKASFYYMHAARWKKLYEAAILEE